MQPEIVAKIIERKRPHAILPTLGGQTCLNTAVKVAGTGLLEKLGVEMIGASIPVIRKAEEREQFRDAMGRIGLRVPESGIARDMDQARKVAKRIGYSLIIMDSSWPERVLFRNLCVNPGGLLPAYQPASCQGA